MTRTTIYGKNRRWQRRDRRKTAQFNERAEYRKGETSQLIARRLYYSERITPVLDDREVMDIIHAHVHITETRK